jgi:hypothetical protein
MNDYGSRGGNPHWFTRMTITWADRVQAVGRDGCFEFTGFFAHWRPPAQEPVDMSQGARHNHMR